MSAKHTPGPWFQYADDPLVIVNAEGSSIGEASAGDPYISAEEQLANARMFAAVPELLAALRTARQELRFKNLTQDGGQQTNTVIARALVEIDAAIAKAEAA